MASRVAWYSSVLLQLLKRRNKLKKLTASASHCFNQYEEFSVKLWIIHILPNRKCELAADLVFALITINAWFTKQF